MNNIPFNALSYIGTEGKYLQPTVDNRIIR